jgi:hypothetical protein
MALRVLRGLESAAHAALNVLDVAQIVWSQGKWLLDAILDHGIVGSRM